MMRLLFLVLICVNSWGCRDTREQGRADAQTATSRAAVELTVLVVDDSTLAQGMTLVAGEWAERSGGQLTVAECTLNELLVMDRPAADVVVYPSRLVGEFVMRGWLRPVRPSVLADPDLAWSDFFPSLRDQMARFAGEVYALPLGDQPLALAWSGSLPSKLPTSWDQLAGLKAGIATADLSRFPLTREFVARALALTTPAERASLFFNPQTMDARLATPPMVKSLEWLIDSMKGSATLETQVVLPRETAAATMLPLPIAGEVYTSSMDRWEQSENDDSAVVLGFAGRLVSVTTSSRNAASAFQLIPWLTSGSTGTKLSQRSQATLWCRTSQIAKAGSWLPAKSDDDRTRWLSQQLSRGDSYLLPRISGIDRYLGELEAALKTALAGQQPTEQVLTTAEVKWNALTDELGRDLQRVAFNRHLGLAE